MEENKRLGQYDIRTKLLGNLESLLKLKQGQRPFPFSISIYPSNLCNHRCNFCEGVAYLKENSQTLKIEIVRKLLTDLKDMGSKSITWAGGGEPLLHEDYYEMLELSNSLGLSNGLITNFSAIKSEKISTLIDNLVWLRISFNAGNRETYHKIHGVDHFEQVKENIQLLLEENAKKNNKLQISLSMVYKKDNINSMTDLIKMAISLGVKAVHIKPDQFIKEVIWLKSDEVKNILKETRELPAKLGSNIQITTSEYLEKQYLKEYPKKCYAHFLSIIILASGDVGFCRSRFDDTETHCGNIYKSSIKEIWDSEKIKRLENDTKPCQCAGFCRQMHVNVHTDKIVNIPDYLNVEFI